MYEGTVVYRGGRQMSPYFAQRRVEIAVPGTVVLSPRGRGLITVFPCQGYTPLAPPCGRVQIRYHTGRITKFYEIGRLL